ncbi:TIGR03986 family type III CRISPR-associated RAMP protein [Selenomonas artemidis]|uniref:TIGR03986 family type III CRISPR-associated RAMP protein n=1 Tax=Selenomonas artemidis TaxID=671224 RepID=UPI0004087FC5|nr:TIGR03986 family CRISPR-associated RAMP protein [Selenomonas artemidis]
MADNELTNALLAMYGKDHNKEKQQKTQAQKKKKAPKPIIMDTGNNASRSMGRSGGNAGGGRSGGYAGGSSHGGGRQTGISHGGSSRGNNWPSPRQPDGNFSIAYNFVSLPEAILASPLEDVVHGAPLRAKKKKTKEDDAAYKNAYRSYIENVGVCSGHIDLHFQTLTPLFIGGFDAEEEEVHGFFSPAGRPVIPGSSLRGMARSLFKIVTAGSMREGEDFTNRHLYFRGMAARRGSFHDHYVDELVQSVPGQRKSKTRAQAGFLMRVGQNYCISPAKHEPVSASGNDLIGPKAWWSDQDKSVVCATGKMQNKKHNERIYGAQWNVRHTIPQEVVNDYTSDKSRFSGDQQNKEFSLLDAPNLALTAPEKIKAFTGRDDIDYLVPCFYVERQGVVKHFGQGPYYRIAYNDSIADRVPASLRDDLIDFTDAVFGATEYWAGRVSFEDAELEGEVKFLSPALSKPLMEAKPTSFQLYLEQNGSHTMHWDEDTSIRGAKLYWHRKIGDKEWRATKDDPVITGTKEIRPVAAGASFTTRLYFERLSQVELGALLKVFYLQRDSRAEGKKIAYKIGRGKSLGMGSIRLTKHPQLFIDDARSAYGSFLTDGTIAPSVAAEEPTSYVEAFDAFAKEHMADKELKRYDLMMEELLTLLDWSNTENQVWKDKTKMMGVDNRNFRERSVLPDALSFVNSTRSPRR